MLELATRNRACAFEPVLAVSAVIRGCDGDSLFDIWSEKLFALTVTTIGIMRCGESAKATTTVVLPHFLSHSVMPTAMFSSFSLETAHIFVPG